MGRDLERSARKRGKPLRWWQRLVARRVLEVDAAGLLCWGEFLVSLARQGGKSWLLRELAMWRLESAARIGEEQLVMHVANKLSNANEVQRPARSWAAVADGWVARNGQGTQHIAAPDGSRWFLFSSESVYGWSAGLALVDECWDVEPSVVSDGVEPAMTERLWPQLGLLSTSHPRATALFVDRRRAALEGGDALLIEWSARSWLALDDREGWRAAAPHWSAQRERLVAKALAKALRPSSAGPGEPDPVESFRCQWLNQWPERSTDDMNLPGERLLPPGAWGRLEADDAPNEPAVFAVDDRGGLSVAVAAAARCASGRIVVEAYPETDRRAAYEWARVHAEPGSTVLVGPSLQFDTGVVELGGVMPLSVQTFGNTRSALAALRQLVTRNAVCHTGSGELAEQVENCRVAEGTAGLRVISSAPWDLLRVAAWALAGADRARRGVPSVY